MKDSLTFMGSCEVYGDSTDKFMDLEGASEELLPSINNDFIPRRSHLGHLRNVFPSGFGVGAHRQPVTKAEGEGLDAFDLSKSLETASVVKGKVPDNFSFMEWTQGGDENMESPDAKGRDSYTNVAGAFRRIPSRFSMRPGSSTNKMREVQLDMEIDNRHLMRYTNPALAGILTSDVANNDDIDALVETLENDLGRSIDGHDDESVHETLSLASVVTDRMNVA